MPTFAKLCLPFVLCLAATLVVIALRPDLDLAAARVFYVGSKHFVGQIRAAAIVRYAAWALPFLVFLGALVAARPRESRPKMRRAGLGGGPNQTS